MEQNVTSIVENCKYHIVQKELDKDEWLVVYSLVDKRGKNITLRLPLEVVKSVSKSHVESGTQNAHPSSSEEPQSKVLSRTSDKQEASKVTGILEEVEEFEPTILSGSSTLAPLKDSWNEALANMENVDDIHSSQAYLNMSQSTQMELDTNDELSYPHVPYSVEELSFVKTLVSWSNKNVRVIGKIIRVEESECWKLENRGEGGKLYTLDVDISALASQPPEERNIQIFGELLIATQSSKPCIKAKFFRLFESVDLFYYNNSVNRLRRRLPFFINRKLLKSTTQELNSENTIK